VYPISGPSVDTVLKNLQESFNSIQYAFQNLQLLLNPGKTKCMLFNRSLPVPACLPNIITLDGSELEFVDTYKYLGVLLDSSLSFQPHITKLSSKIKCRIGFLFRNRASFTYGAKLALAKMTIIPMFDFGDVIYRTASDSLLKKLDVVYHSVIRFVTNAPYNTHHCKLYALVGWKSLTTLRLTHWYQLIYKSLLGKVPSYLSCLVSIALPSRILRSSRYIVLVTPKVRTAFGQKSFQFAAAKDWNELQKNPKT